MLTGPKNEGQARAEVGALSVEVSRAVGGPSLPSLRDGRGARPLLTRARARDQKHLLQVKLS